MIDELDTLADDLINVVTDDSTHRIREGTVMTMGPPPYRRLDCGGRALAYVRSRPRKGAVRVDISGLWVKARASYLEVRGSSGSVSLMLRCDEDIEEAASYLGEIVAHTRRLEREHAQRARAAQLTEQA